MIYPSIKRALDVVFSILAIVLLSPLMLLTAAAVALESRGGALYGQYRLGKSEKPFMMLKFRSMYKGSEGRGTGVYSGKGDARVTKVGRFIRAASIDELPQLFNILVGQMSFVGPRPVLPYHPWPLSEYSGEQRRRFSVRPGLTGLAQINGRKQTPWVERIHYDLEYVDGLSFTTDVKILFRTLVKVFRRESNFSETDSVTGKVLPTNIEKEKAAK